MKTAHLLLLACLVAIPTTARGQVEESAVTVARVSSDVAGASLDKVQRWLHEVALKKIEPDTGLYHPDGNFNYQDAWADCYPFLCWAAWATDQEALNGPIRRALHAEIEHCPDGYFADPRNAFGGSEYVKDGLVAIVEVTGKDEWFDRMREIEDAIWSNPSAETPYGRIPSTNIEINGEQLQILARLYTMTGEEKYLTWAERLADYYLLKGDFVPSRLRDHGCEIIGGLGLLLGVESEHRPEKAKIYGPHIRRMCDEILKRGINEDGIMYNTIDNPRSGLSDGWGYDYVGFLCYDLATGQSVYRPHIERTLRNLSKPLYKDYRWEGSSIDGFADSIEGGIYCLNRLPVPEGLAWVNQEVAANVAYASDPDRLWGTMKLQSNGVRTVIMHALMRTRGCLARPWKQGLKLGACQTDDGLIVFMRAATDWKGRLVLDIPRHREYIGLKNDWPRMNTMPEWFTVEPDQQYTVTSGSLKKTYSGKQLHEGLPVELKGGEEVILRIVRK